MTDRTLDLTNGSMWGRLALFALPLALSRILQVLFNMADVAVVGRFAGAAALGAVGCTSTAANLFIGFALGMGAAVNALTARCIGSGDEEETGRMIHTSVILCVLVGFAVLAIGESIVHWMLTIMQTKDELMAGALLYLRIYLLALPAFCVYNFGNGVFSAVGDTRKPLYILLMSGIMNVALNLVFVLGLHWDEAGVALATVISMYAAAGVIIYLLARRKDSVRLCLGRLRVSRSCARQVLTIGLAAGVQEAVFCIANLFTQYGVNTFPALTVEGNSAAANADSLVYGVMAAIYTGGASFIGQNYGAGKMDRVKKAYYISTFYAVASAWVLGWLLVIFGRQFLGLFTTDPEVIEAGLVRLTLMALCYCISGYMDNSISASRAMGRTMVPTVMVILGSCVFRVAWIFTVFRCFGTIMSLYMLYPVSWMLTGIAEILYFAHVCRAAEKEQKPKTS